MHHTNQNGLTRRGFCLCCVGTAAFAATGGLLAPEEAQAKGGIIELILSEAAKTPITTHKLRGGVSMLEGSGGNIA
ncbi:MAG: MBL fold metallo-hydrolase, partial [Rhizobiaceae bacterium]|nr:MBL fold metallo-hydrolase [Rhizobiaceae bacterium]